MFPGAFAASEKQVMFAPMPQEPGYATLLAPGMPSISGTLPIEDAEMHKINHDRRVCSLEPMGTMPETHYTKGKACRYCQQAAEMRCADCWAFYCSKTCQRRHWSTHLFGCRVPKRPNLVDYLRYSVEKVNKAIGSGDENAISQSISELFADDDICRAFGFSNCSGITETMLLAQLYATVISSLRTPMRALRLALEARDLKNFLRFFCEEKMSKSSENQQHRCIMWFLEHSKGDDPCIFDQKNTRCNIWVNAIAQSLELLGLEERLRNGEKLDFAQTQVFHLFINIQPFIGWFPDIYSSVWKNFGFCYCKTYQQKRDLAKAYMALAYSEASFDDMVTAYKTWTMEDLMKKQGISPPFSLKRPSVSEDAVFRLMTGVEHALSGRHCTCFQMSKGRLCHSGFETHLDIQSDVCYGFHLSSSWERWRLLNFYKMLFQLPGFNPREMAKAKECGQKGDLEGYLNSLVPNMRRYILEIERAQSIIFPQLNGHISMNKVDGEEGPAPQFYCACKMHDMAGPPGLQWISADQVIKGSTICAQIEDGMPLLKAGT